MKVTALAIISPTSVVSVVSMNTKRRGKKSTGAKMKERKCLMCQRTFQSQGSHNRICQRCTATETYRSGQLPSHF